MTSHGHRLRRGLLVGAAAVLVLSARLLVRVVPFRAARRLAGRVPVVARHAAGAAEIAWAVATATCIMRLRNSCLPEALAMHALLAAVGIPSTLRFGVGRRGSGIRAHASVMTADGVVLGQARDGRFFALESPPSARHA